MRRAAVLSTFLLLATAACSANMQTVQDESVDSAETHSFDASYAEVVQAAVDGIARLGFDITRRKEDAQGSVILFVRPTSMTQMGAVGRLVIDRSAAPPTTVHVNYERRWGLGGAGQERLARNLFLKMQQALGAGGPKEKS